MNKLLLELIRPSANVTLPETIERLTHRVDWPSFCSLAYRTRLASLAYVQLRKYAANVPKDVLDWLRNQYYETTARNLLQLNNLFEVTTRLSNAKIPVLALKGPVLAHFGLGFRVRNFSDLDLLVQHSDLGAVARLLGSLGYVEAHYPPHPFHRRYLRAHCGPAAIIEVHFDLAELIDSSVRPDVPSIWARSSEITFLGGRSVRAPELTDHLLLAMIQLPHHHWAPRLVADFGAIMSRCGDMIDWEGLVPRAEAWGMRALLGSTLHVLSSLLRVDLPQELRSRLKPDYFRRMQWHVARLAVEENLSYGRHLAIFRIASVLMVDQPSDVVRLLGQSVYFRNEDIPKIRAFSGGMKRFMAGIASLPSLFGILLRSATPTNLR